MAVGQDFVPKEVEFDEGPSYPTVFGLTLTPTIIGALAAVVGLGVAGFLWTSVVQPSLDTYQDLDRQVQQKRDQVKQQANIQSQIKAANKNLEDAKQNNKQVLALFADSKALDTLLLDLNQVIQRNNAGVPAELRRKLANCSPGINNVYRNPLEIQKLERELGPLVTTAKLGVFKPDLKASGVITDGSFGPQVNGKLKRQVVNVKFGGNYSQTQSIFRTLERLQSLVLVKKLTVCRVVNLEDMGTASCSNSTTIPSLYQVGADGSISFPASCQPDTTLLTTFDLEALLPLTPEEQATLAPKPSPSPGASPVASPAASPGK